MNSKILVIGSSNTDMTVVADKLPSPGETVIGGHFSMGPGGKGANQAVAVCRLGQQAGFVCKIGRDIFGDNALKAYRAEGLDTTGVLRCDTPSGVALITVDAGAENCIVVASGANAEMTPEDIDSLKDLITGAEVLLMQLEIPLPAVRRAAHIAHEAGVTVVLNPAPAVPLDGSLLADVDILVPNEHEAALLSGLPVDDEKSAGAAAAYLQSMGVRDVIITLGARGALVCRGADAPVAVPALKVKAVDTTAAGDTFCGALCVALTEGLSLEQAARFAARAAALTVQRVGAQEAIPYRNELI